MFINVPTLPTTYERVDICRQSGMSGVFQIHFNF